MRMDPKDEGRFILFKRRSQLKWKEGDIEEGWLWRSWSNGDDKKKLSKLGQKIEFELKIVIMKDNSNLN